MKKELTAVKNRIKKLKDKKALIDEELEPLFIREEELENEEIIAEINASGADMLFAALGAPKQENWLARFRSELKPQVLMGVGGSFDVLAGKMDRAPLWMQKASLEWLFRLYKQPSRIGRMMVLPQFVIKVLQSK